MSARYLIGDSLSVLKSLDDKSVDCVVTSPPYFGQRRYTDDDCEIGIGSLLEYLDSLLAVTNELLRVVSDTGTLWINIGDTASKSGGAGGDYGLNGSRAGLPKYTQGVTGLAAMTWCAIPQRLAIAMIDQGWLMRSWITWDKGQERREDTNHIRRPRLASEPILFFSRTRDYLWNGLELAETGDVWHFPPSRGSTGHQAPFPVELPQRCIRSTTRPQDVVLDPFAGSGTTLQVAIGHGRSVIGIDLDQRNADLARERLGMFLEVEDRRPSKEIAS